MAATYKKIDRTAVDALLHGLLKSLESMGGQRSVILDDMGTLMCQYLVETRTIPHVDRPGKSSSALKRLLIRNGFAPLATAPNLVEIMAQKAGGHDAGTPTGRGTSKEGVKVDWVLYEAILYGMTKALDDQLGLQAQLILDRIGTLMLDYLIDVGAIKRSEDLNILLQRVVDYFVKAGYAKSFSFELEGAPPNTFVSRYESARYYTNVFRRTQREGSALLACPLCVIGHSLWATRGWRFGNIFEVQISSGGKVLSRARVYPATERFTESDALRLSRTKL